MAPAIHGKVSALVLLNRYDEASVFLSYVLRSQEENKNTNSTFVSEILNELGNIHMLQGSPKLATSCYGESAQLKMEIFGANHPSFLGTERNYAIALAKTGLYNAAESILHDNVLAKQIELPSTMSNDLELATTLDAFAKILLSNKQTSRALEYCKASLELRERHLDKDDILIVESCIAYGGLLLDVGCLDEGTIQCSKVINSLKSLSLSKNHPVVLEFESFIQRAENELDTIEG